MSRPRKIRLRFDAASLRVDKRDASRDRVRAHVRRAPPILVADSGARLSLTSNA
jgi:hypothetical protein